MRDALILLLDIFFKSEHDCSLALVIFVVSEENMKPGGGRQEKINKTRIFNAIVKKIYHVKATKYYKNW